MPFRFTKPACWIGRSAAGSSFTCWSARAAPRIWWTCCPWWRPSGRCAPPSRTSWRPCPSGGSSAATGSRSRRPRRPSCWPSRCISTTSRSSIGGRPASPWRTSIMSCRRCPGTPAKAIPPTPDPPDIRQAAVDFQAGRYGQALEKTRLLLRQGNREPAVVLLAARCHLALGQPGQALALMANHPVEPRRSRLPIPTVADKPRRTCACAGRRKPGPCWSRWPPARGPTRRPPGSSSTCCRLLPPASIQRRPRYPAAHPRRPAGGGIPTGCPAASSPRRIAGCLPPGLGL